MQKSFPEAEKTTQNFVTWCRPSMDQGVKTRENLFCGRITTTLTHGLLPYLRLGPKVLTPARQAGAVWQAELFGIFRKMEDFKESSRWSMCNFPRFQRLEARKTPEDERPLAKSNQPQIQKKKIIQLKA